MPKGKYTIKFNCKQFGESSPDVILEKLEWKDELQRGCYNFDTWTVEVFRDEDIIYVGSNDHEPLKKFILRYQIQKEIIDTQNDINEYFKSDVPMECNAFDVDNKLEAMKKTIFELLKQ